MIGHFLYNIFLNMSNQENKRTAKKQKSIKNIYIHKINSLLKIVGDSNCSLPCLSKVRKTIFSESLDHLMLQRKENNKDAARKARLRKKLYMELLQQTIQNLKQMNEQGKRLQKASNQLIASLKVTSEVKEKDQLDQYFTEIGVDKTKKQQSQATMDMEKGGQLNKITMQIQMIAFPREWSASNLKGVSQNSENNRLISRIQGIQQQLPELYTDLKNICSEHNSLFVMSSSNKNQNSFDPYFCKTLMEQYYSKTICKKDMVGVQTNKSLNLLTRMDKYEWRSQLINQCDLLSEN